MELLHNFFQVGFTVGLASSPFIGSFIYKSFGYKGPFLVAAIISLPPLFLRVIMKGIEFPNDEQHNGNTLRIVLKNTRGMLTLAHFAMTQVLLSTLETCLSDRLMEVFNFSPSQVAIYFFIFFGGALTWSVISALFLSRANKGNLILISLIICSISLLS